MRTSIMWKSLAGVASLGFAILASYVSNSSCFFYVCLAIALVLQAIHLFDFRLGTRPEVYAAFASLHKSNDWPAELRICLYTKCLFRRDHLKQASPYAPTQLFGSGQKGIDSAKGIVGRTFRTGKKYIELLPQGEDFADYMKENWGFTNRDVGKMHRDKAAYMAIPILDKNANTKAVIFLDAPRKHSKLFTDKLSDSLERVAIYLASIV